MFPIAISQVHTNGHLEMVVQQNGHPDQSLVLEVYSGVLNFLLDGGDVHAGDTVVSFVPMGDPVGQAIHDYAEPECQLLNEPAVMVAPANMTVAAGEAHDVAAHAASVLFTPQTFPGVPGSPTCLVIRVPVALRNTRLTAITYQISLLWLQYRPTTLTVPGGSSPVL
ncbi:hypothetical protein ACFTUC_34555 [Streptomyces sp. NPDC056944]|uniref:hypothetical protein n=1 Tax=Streptomyces sp. NPDC056944 TaxID=3345972 RepID=UPI00362CD771